MHEVEVTKRIAAARDDVWKVYADYAGWGDWAGLGKARLAREGSPDPNGSGCIRELDTPVVAIHEEILDFEPPQRMTYRIVKGGGAITNHLGEVRMQEDAGETLIVWRARFDSRVPGLGFLLKLFVRTVFQTVLNGLEKNRFPRA